MKLFKTLIGAAGMAVLLAGAAFAQSEVLATVDGAEITEKDLEIARIELADQLGNVPAGEQRRELLLFLIENQLLAGAAEKENMHKDADAEDRMKYYRRRALRDAYYQKKVRNLLTEDRLKRFYDDQVAKLDPKEEFRFRHILVESEEDAYDIIERINRGSDFSELAKEESKGPSGAQGGDLGYMTKGRLVPEFEKVAFGLKKGEVSEPVKTQFGWHVIKLEDKRMQTPPPFEEVKAGMKSTLTRQRAAQVLKKLRQAVEIDILDKDVKKAIEEAYTEEKKSGAQ